MYNTNDLVELVVENVDQMLRDFLHDNPERQGDFVRMVVVELGLVRADQLTYETRLKTADPDCVYCGGMGGRQETTYHPYGSGFVPEMAEEICGCLV